MLGDRVGIVDATSTVITQRSATKVPASISSFVVYSAEIFAIKL
jgi:hypothetical protein